MRTVLSPPLWWCFKVFEVSSLLFDAILAQFSSANWFTRYFPVRSLTPIKSLQVSAFLDPG